MVSDEKQLAEAIMRGDSRIELDLELAGGVDKIKAPSSVAWKSVFAALVASAFFWASPAAAVAGFTLGLPVVLAVSGGVGGIVFVTLGAKGLLCAFRLLIASQTADVLTKLRDDYDLKETYAKGGEVETAVLIQILS